MSYDTLEAAAKQAGYKLNWAEEVTWATMIEGLRAGRYDMICSGIWVSSTRAQFADFTAPIFYNAVNVYVRTGDSRFDNNLPLAAKYAAINQKDVKIATIDGEITAIVADQRFPQASRFALPQNTDLPQLLLSVVDRKADVTFMDPYTAAQFLKSHPGTLRDISSEQPIQVYPLSYIVPKGNYALRDLMNAMLSEVINNGTVDGIITKYDIAPGTVYPLAYPYRTPIQPPGR
jgi:ABC-type amino acid transport substrate-binding protein